MEKKYKAIFTPYVARRLLKMGHKIADIRPRKESPSETIFIFEVDETFNDDLIIASKH